MPYHSGMGKMIKRYNIRHNTGSNELPECGKMINGQAIGAVAGLRYGLCRMSFNGCEVIAVHNALVYMGIPRQVSEIAGYMERYRMLIGIFGCSPYKIGKALRHFGCVCKRKRYPDDSGAFIITFWTKRPFLSSLHTVFCVRENGAFRVYNLYNDCPDSRLCGSIAEFAGKRRPVAVYALGTIDDVPEK